MVSPGKSGPPFVHFSVSITSFFVTLIIFVDRVPFLQWTEISRNRQIFILQLINTLSTLRLRHCIKERLLPTFFGLESVLSLLVLYSTPRGFSPGTPVFPSPQKPTFDLI